MGVLAFIIEGAGTVTSSPVQLADRRVVTGLLCTGRCTKRFPVGALVSVYARPAPGYEFAGWSGDCRGDGQIGSVRLSRRTSCTATFREKAAE